MIGQLITVVYILLNMVQNIFYRSKLFYIPQHQFMRDPGDREEDLRVRMGFLSYRYT